jgi:hypothetical protein
MRELEMNPESLFGVASHFNYIPFCYRITSVRLVDLVSHT